MTIEKKIKYHPHVINHFKEPTFYNTYIEKPNTTKVKTIDLLS